MGPPGSGDEYLATENQLRRQIALAKWENREAESMRKAGSGAGFLLGLFCGPELLAWWNQKPEEKRVYNSHGETPKEGRPFIERFFRRKWADTPQYKFPSRTSSSNGERPSNNDSDNGDRDSGRSDGGDGRGEGPSDGRGPPSDDGRGPPARN